MMRLLMRASSYSRMLPTSPFDFNSISRMLSSEKEFGTEICLLTIALISRWVCWRSSFRLVREKLGWVAPRNTEATEGMKERAKRPNPSIIKFNIYKMFVVVVQKLSYYFQKSFSLLQMVTIF